MDHPLAAPTARPWTIVRAALVAPFGRRVVRELSFCLSGIPFLLVNPIVLFFPVVDLCWWISAHGRGNPSPADIGVAGGCMVVLLVLLVTTGAARRIGSWQRALVRRLLGIHLAPPLPSRGDDRRGLRRRWRDASGWRAIAYLVVKLPVVLLGAYSAFCWVGGLVNLSYPLWWGAFRNHPSGTRLDAVPVFTPIGMFGSGTFDVATFPGTLAAAGAGAAMLLVAPWLARGVAAVDVRLIQGLLGPGRLAQRVHDLEQRRALAVDDSAALARRLERDLHDGAQIRLATVAMNLGMAREKLGDTGAIPDADAVRELVDAALRGAKDAIRELRSLVRGIHPPVLDNGLADALASLAADSAIPVDLEVEVPARPAAAIETIAYFCAAELLANAAKHSNADAITVRVVAPADVLRLEVSDTGTGGADATRGTGLAGLEQRVAVVDGRLTISSPPGGPTQVTVEVPLRA